MCVPLGHRNHRSSSGGNVITKERVERIISSKDSMLWTRGAKEKEFRNYNGTKKDLIEILHQAETQIKEADGRFKVYKEGFWTIIINATSQTSIYLVRIKL